MSKLNVKLRVLLKNNEWTQAELAKLLDISPDAVSSWVRGINTPTLATIKELCQIFSIPIQELTDDDFDIPEFIVLAQYLPHSDNEKSKELQDQEHIIIDANLPHEGMLHRFKNAKGIKCSAIYIAKQEVWWHYRENEAEMIRYWNEVYRK